MNKKKLLLLVLFTIMMGTNVFAQTPQAQQTPIVWIVQGWNDKPLTHGPAKGPDESPVVYLEDYTLTFEVDHPEFVLYIKDEDEVVVYSTVVTSATTEVVLPSTLSADYEIDLIMGDWLFSGWINLN